MRKTLIIAAAALAIAAPVLAKPGKADAPKPAAQRPPAEVVLASADSARGSAMTGVQPSSVPVKRPAPRVTTCRCGDQQIEPQSQEQ